MTTVSKVRSGRVVGENTGIESVLVGIGVAPISECKNSISSSISTSATFSLAIANASGSISTLSTELGGRRV